MKNIKAIIVTLISFVVVCALAGVGIFTFRQRLGLGLNDPTPRPFSTNRAVSAASTSEFQKTFLATPTSLPATATPLPVPTAASAGTCGETGAWNILVLGSDLRETSRLRGSDLTRVMRVDFSNNRVIVYAFPRDLWVDTTGLGLTNPTINATQLGMVFYEGRIRSPQFGVREIMVDGLRVSADALYKNFSVNVDHYLALDLNQLPPIVDAVGGIPIYVPERTTDFWRPILIQPGQQVLNGRQTEDYSRAFMGSDFDRIERNQILLDAIRQKLLDPSVWMKIPALYQQFSNLIVTDFSPEQIVHLSCLLKDIPATGVLQESVRPEWTSPGPNGSLLWNSYNVMNRLRELGLVP
ncbi:MAG TPA: LCP family protein [Anaerolineales bacterium]|jgi:LCP family protein required for cell wall assembly